MSHENTYENINVISFDIGIKTLATSVIEYRNINKELKSIIDIISITDTDKLTQSLNDIDSLLDKRINVHFLDVKDLIPGKKIASVTPVQITKLLYDYLCEITDVLCEGIKYKVLIEYQMGPNDKARNIASQIMMFFTSYDFEIEIVGPSLKNKIFLGEWAPENETLHCNFVAKYSSLYSANKQHSKFVFTRLLELWNNKKDDNNNSDKKRGAKEIKKNVYKDIGDSVLMSLAWMKKKYPEYI